jgi:hypothetical protein
MAELTVSRIPLALGDPSIRIGLPPMYFEIFWSRGSNVGFIKAAAASSCVESGLERGFWFTKWQTFSKLFHKNVEPWTSGSVWVQVLVAFVPVRVLQTNGLKGVDNRGSPHADMRNEKLALFIQREQSMDDLLERLDGPRPVA